LVDPPIETFPVDDAWFRVGEPSDNANLSYVGNMYALYVDDPGRLDELVNKTVRAIVETQTERMFDPDKLVVVARPIDYGGPDLPDLVKRPLAGDLCLLLAQDGEAALCPLRSAELEKHNLTEEQAFSLALKALPSRLGELSTGPFGDSAVYHVNAESGLATGAIALPDLWSKSERPKVVFVDTREMFFWGYADDERAVSFLRRYATARIETFDTVSKTVLRLDERGWTDIGLQDA
jgi:hypothetical protein